MFIRSSKCPKIGLFQVIWSSTGIPILFDGIHLKELLEDFSCMHFKLTKKNVPRKLDNRNIIRYRVKDTVKLEVIEVKTRPYRKATDMEK